MKYTLDLRYGLGDYLIYKMWKFIGGEIHFKLKDLSMYDPKYTSIQILTRLNSVEDIFVLGIVTDTIQKDIRYNSLGFKPFIEVVIPYMAYQQADRDFGIGECFSLTTMANFLNALHVNRYIIYMPHSEITPALMPKAVIIDDRTFIRDIISNVLNVNDEDIFMLTPDAGAYKRSGKLISAMNFQGSLVSANKYRNLNSGDIESLELSLQDFNGSDVLIVDDLCMGGNTFIGLAKEIQKRNVGNLYLAVSHMVPQVINEELLQYFTRIFTTNSRFGRYISGTITVVSNQANESLYVHDIFPTLTK